MAVVENPGGQASTPLSAPEAILTQNRAYGVRVTPWDIYQRVALEVSGQRRYRPEPLVGIGSEGVNGCFKGKGNESEMDSERDPGLETYGPRICPSGARTGQTA
jgi:hypothetical protein